MTSSKGEEVHSAEGWTVQSEQVRKFASKVGIPEDVPLPEVIVVDESVDEYYRSRPQISQSSSGTSPSGYFITLPSKFLERDDVEDYVLGPGAIQDIKHELTHYAEYLEGGNVGQEKKPYAQAVKEVRIELHSGAKPMSLALARVAGGLRDDYGLTDMEALKIVFRAARSLGVSNRVIGKTKRMLTV